MIALAHAASWIAFLAESLVSALVTALLAVLACGVIEPMQALAFFPPLIWLTIALPPFLVFMAGVLLKRPGVAIGPFVMAAAIHVGSIVLFASADALTAPMTAIVAKPIRNDHRVVALQGVSCEEPCLHVLAAGSHVVARPFAGSNVREPQWTVYRPATGEACRTVETIALSFKFLELGYPGHCAKTETLPEFGDGLLLRGRSMTIGDPDFSPRFRGTVHEVYERLSGTDHLLGRRMTGSMTSPFPLTLAVYGPRPQPFDLGPRIDVPSFLSAATGIAVGDLGGRRRPFPLAEVLDELERHVGRTEPLGGSAPRSIGALAVHTWKSIVAVQGREHAAVLQARVEALLVSPDPVRPDLGLSGLDQFPRAGGGFADERLFDLLFVDLPDEAGARVIRLLRWRFADAAAPVALRQRARAALQQPGLSAARRAVLETIARD